MHPLRQRMLQDMQIRNFALSTQRAYIQAIARFAQHFGRSPDQLGPEEIRAYQVYLIEEKHMGCGGLSNVVSALRFFDRTTLGKDLRMQYIPFLCRERKLPVLLSL